MRSQSGSGSSRRGRRAAIAAILMMVIAVLIGIALVTHDPADEAVIAGLRVTDLFKLVSADPLIRARADMVQNGLGLVGAMLSDALIRLTLGYAIFAFPLLLLLWGWTLLRRLPLRPAFVFTNYALITALLISGSFGMVRLIAAPGGPGMEWSGIIGEFIAAILSQLIGKAGGAIVLVVALLVTAVIAVDLDIRYTIERTRRGLLRLADWTAQRNEAWREAAERRRMERERTARVTVARPPEAEPPRPTLTPPPPSAGPIVAVPYRREEPEGDLKITVGRPASPLGGDSGQDKTLREETAKDNAGMPEEIDYVFPSVDLLDPPRPGREDVDDEELKANADLLRATLAEFNVELESVSVTPGPVVTLYELVPASGVKISSIVSLENDMALKLAARGIRIMAPIPGKSAVGVEIPNSHRSLVTIRSVINSMQFRELKGHLPLAMGKTISGEVYCDDLTRMPHLLIAGSTGSGKSVGINTILASLLYRLHPSDLKFVIIDPKKIELAQYAQLKHHFLAVSPDIGETIVTTPNNAVIALRGVELEMERRYDRLASAGVRNIVDYNERLAAGRLRSSPEAPHAKMPFLLVVIDELADLMITAAREVEEPIARLAQLARAVGIHLIVATQRPSVDVITGVIKANFPARIAYQVASKTDSRTILDMNGAEQLLGNGDMLYLAAGSPKPVRLQNSFISADEVEALVNHIGNQRGYTHPFPLPSLAQKRKNGEGEGEGERDELFDEAARLVVRHQQGSVSLLQRRLKVGYSRAARLVDELEAAGIVGPYDGSKARDVLVETEAELDVILSSR
ncbi:MAG: DNA translocase FtsK 4TM domain-containing protein [Bacteroidota bacterium]